MWKETALKKDVNPKYCNKVCSPILASFNLNIFPHQSIYCFTQWKLRARGWMVRRNTMAFSISYWLLLVFPIVRPSSWTKTHDSQWEDGRKFKFKIKKFVLSHFNSWCSGLNGFKALGGSIKGIFGVLLLCQENWRHPCWCRPTCGPG